MTDEENPTQRTLQVMTGDFLKAGYILANRKGGELYLYQIESGIEPKAQADTIVSAINDLLEKPDTIRIFLAHEDSAIATEFYPEFFQTNNRIQN